MSDKNISPKVAPSVYSIMKRMEKMGLTEDDLITLVHRRVKNVSRGDIGITLAALKNIESNFKRAQKE